jgi:hypothetical protein
MEPKPLTLRIQYAAMRSSLPKEVRHLVHAMAVLANSETGEGWHGQQTIARLVGCSDRHVRNMLAFLDSDENESGIRVDRRARFHQDGRGRTSDFWRLVSADLPEQVDTTNRNAVPPEHGSTGTPRRTNRKSTTDQPEPCSGDLRSDRRSERRSKDRAVARDVRRRPVDGSKKPKPEGQSSEHKQVTEHYFERYEAEHGEKPIFDSVEGKAVNALLKKVGSAEKANDFIDRAFESFRRKTVTIQQIAKDPSAFHADAPKRGQRPVQAATSELDLLGKAAGEKLAGGHPGDSKVVPFKAAAGGGK